MTSNDSNDTTKFGGRHHSAKSGQSGPNLSLIAGAIIVVYVVVFFFTNSHMVMIDFVVYHKTLQTRWLILVCLVLGVLADRLVSRWWRNRRQKPDEKN
ncbi:unannotated protein [freshwater metagenome]|uniref:Unannotated protein n=1 Tax=freshwater metagenome TaxID=449393 RepID=A0A6J7EDK3_9ZZZZ|nr:hypothetical protein [Actinomycetota bacterium]